MDEIRSSIDTYDSVQFNDFKQWKLFCSNLFHKITPRILTLPEPQLLALFEQWQKDANKCVQIESTSYVLHKLLMIYLLLEYTYSHDLMRNYIPWINSKISNENIVVVKISAFIMKFSVQRSPSNSDVFGVPLTYVASHLSLDKHYRKALIVLNQAIQVIPLNSIQLVASIFSFFTEILLQNQYDAEILKYVLNIIRFYIVREHSDESKNIYNSSFQYLTDKVIGVVYLLDIIYDIRADLFQNQTIEMINLLINLEDILAAKLVLKISQNLTIFDFDVNKIISIIMANGDFQLLKKAIFTYGQKIDPEPILDFIQNNLTQTSLDRCSFDLYYSILSIFPDISIALSPPIICAHYIQCIKLRPCLLTDHIINYFKHVIETNDISRMKEALLFHTIHPFIENISEVIIKNLNLFDEETKITILNNFSEHCTDVLISLALVDTSKSVRKLALTLISKSFRLSSSPLLYSLLNDPSFKIRKQAIELFANLYKSNPLDLHPLLLVYMKKILYIFTSVLDTSFGAKYASLIATMCECCPEISSMCCGTIVNIFLELTNVLREETYPKLSCVDHSKQNRRNSTSSSIATNYANQSSYINISPYNSFSYSSETELTGTSVYSDDYQFDYVHHDNPRRLSSEVFYRQQPFRKQLLLYTQSEMANKRDGYLVKAIAGLGNIVEPNLQEILKAFYYILKLKSDEDLLITTVKALSKLSSKIFNGLNINLQCPEIINPLIKIVLSTQNEELIHEILKLIGSNFDIIDVSQTQSNTSFWKFHENPTNFILRNLIHNFKELTTLMFKTIALVFYNDPHNASKYTIPYVQQFILVIEKAGEETKDALLNYLEYIIVSVKHEIIPVLPEITRIIHKFINRAKCVHFCIALSSVLGGELVDSATHIYQQCLSNISPMDFLYFKTALKFSVFAILNQNCQFDFLLLSIENFKIPNSKFADKIVKYLMILIDNTDVEFYRCRFAKIALTLIHNGYTQAKSILISLIASIDQPYPLLTPFILQVANFDYKEMIKTYVKKRLSFKLKPISSSYTKPENYFIRLRFPKDVLLNRFIPEFVLSVIVNSPVGSIRACSELFALLPHFIQKLFPLAFLSCWIDASIQDRDFFSDFVDRILRANSLEHNTSNQFLLRIVQLTDMAGYPMKYDTSLISELSYSSHFSMYLLQKKFILDRNAHPDFTKMFLSVNLKLGHTKTIRTLLNQIDDKLTKSEKANWLMNVNEWDSALKLYLETDGPLAKICKCYRYLGKPEEITKLEPLFDPSRSDKTDESYELFAWAFLKTKNYQKAKQYMEMYSAAMTPDRISFSLLFDLLTNDVNGAKRHIENAYKIIGSQKSAFGSGNQNDLNYYFSFLQLLIESQEALEFLSENPVESARMISIWKSRIKGFHRSGISWERMINLRKIAVPIETNFDFYKPIISALRKEKRFHLINDLFGEYFQGKLNVELVVEGFQIHWEMGEWKDVSEAAGLLIQLFIHELTTQKMVDLFREKLNPISINFLSPYWFADEFHYVKRDYFEFLNVTGDDEFREVFFSLPYDKRLILYNRILDKYPEQTYRSVCYNAGIQTIHLREKVYRLYGQWIYKLDSNNVMNLMDSSKSLLTAIKMNPRKVANWRSWAYANLKLFRIFVKNPKPITSPNEAYTTAKDIEYRTKYGKRRLSDSDDRSKGTLGVTRSRRSATVKTKRLSSSPLIPERSEQEKHIKEIRKNLSDHEDYQKLSRSFAKETEYGVLYDDVLLHEIMPRDIENTIKFPEGTMNDSDVYAINAMNGFLKAVSLTDLNTLELLCQFFAILFECKDSSKIPAFLIGKINEIPAKKLIKVIPQITAQIGHPDSLISNIVTQLLVKIGQVNFQRLYFALTGYTKDYCPFFGITISEAKKNHAIRIISEFQDSFSELIQEADLFIDGMERASNTWFEIWSRTLETAMKLRNKSTEKSIKMIRQLIEYSSCPTCEFDRNFLSMFAATIAHLKGLLEEYYPETNGEHKICQSLSDEKHIHIASGYVLLTQQELPFQLNKDIASKFKPKIVSSLDSEGSFTPMVSNIPKKVTRPMPAKRQENSESPLWIFIHRFHSMIQEKINGLSTIHLTYVSEELANRKEFQLKLFHRENAIKIQSINQTLKVISTQQHPRIVYINTSDGERRQYLLKGNEDLRKDGRFIQLFSLMNSIFAQNRETRELRASIVRYAVVPLSKLCGLITWVPDSDTLHQIVCDARNLNKNDKCELKANDKELDIIRQITSIDFSHLTVLQKYEIFQEASKEMKADELFKMMWRRSPNASEWMKRVKRFTLSSALMSMVGYIIGLGDRHPSNILIQRSTGNVVHIDFGESFESTLRRKDFPEKVPFRLTRMIVNSLEGAIYEGMFSDHCNTIMKVIRDNRSSLMAQLVIFVNDPLRESLLISSQEKEENTKTTSQIEQLIKRVEQKLAGDESGITLTVSEQVESLIAEAANPMNYIQHYIGWCPFW